MRDFADSAPWHLVLDPTSGTQAIQGRASKPDLTLACRFEDWAGVMAGREDPRRLVLGRRLRLRGRPRAMLALRNAFAEA